MHGYPDTRTCVRQREGDLTARPRTFVENCPVVGVSAHAFFRHLNSLCHPVSLLRPQSPCNQNSPRVEDIMQAKWQVMKPYHVIAYVKCVLPTISISMPPSASPSFPLNENLVSLTNPNSDSASINAISFSNHPVCSAHLVVRSPHRKEHNHQRETFDVVSGFQRKPHHRRLLLSSSSRTLSPDGTSIPCCTQSRVAMSSRGLRPIRTFFSKPSTHS